MRLIANNRFDSTIKNTIRDKKHLSFSPAYITKPKTTHMPKHDALYSLFGQTNCVLKRPEQMVFVEEAEHLNNRCWSQISSDWDAQEKLLCFPNRATTSRALESLCVCVFSTGNRGSMAHTFRMQWTGNLTVFDRVDSLQTELGTLNTQLDLACWGFSSWLSCGSFCWSEEMCEHFHKRSFTCKYSTVITTGNLATGFHFTDILN